MTARSCRVWFPASMSCIQPMGLVNFLGWLPGHCRDPAGLSAHQICGQGPAHLPTDQVHLLQRYLGGEDKAPKLYSLGGGEWQRVKSRVKESVQKLAFDLLQLYAKRQSVQGHAFAPDTPWQRELEDSFPFQETPDQTQAIQEVKADMESPRPMDRPLCGDGLWQD